MPYTPTIHHHRSRDAQLCVSTIGYDYLWADVCAVMGNVGTDNYPSLRYNDNAMVTNDENQIR